MKLNKLTGFVLTALLCLCLVCAFPGEARAAETPQPVSYQAPTPIAGLVYDGNEHALVSPGTVSGGTMSYSLDGSTYSDTIPTATNAGSYVVYYRVTPNNPDASPSGGTVTATIAKATVTFPYTAPSPKTDLVYNGAYRELVNPGSVSLLGAKILYSVSSAKNTIPGYFSENIPQERDAGTYYVYWMIEGGRNYEDMNASALFQDLASPIEVTIGPATISVNGAENTAKNYDGSTEGPTGLLLTADILPGSVPVDATIISATYASANAGEDIDLSISYRLNGSNCVLSDGGTEGSITVKGSIKPCPIEITPDALTLIYGDAVPKLSYKITSGSLVAGEELNISLSSDYRQFSGVGSYKIKDASLSTANPNYQISLSNAAITVKPKTLEFSGIVPATKIYDGTDSIEYDWSNGVFTGLVNNEQARLELPVADHSVKLASSDVGKDVELILPDWHKLIITGGNANPDNYDLKFTDRVDILPLEVTITPDENQSKIYSQDDPEFSYTYSPKNTLSNGVNWKNIKLQRQSGEDAGSYAFTVAANTTESNFTFKIADNAPKFVIEPFVLEYASTDISPLPEREYTGQALSGRTGITVTLHNGEQYSLVPDDYTLSGGTATALGTHSSTITGKGNFDGELSYSWKIVPPAIIEEVLDNSLTSSNVTLDDAEELRLLEQALNTVTDSTVAAEADKAQWKQAEEKLGPIMEKLKELEIPAWQKLLDKYEPLLDEIEKEAQADDLKLRKEYEELKKQLDAELKALPEADAKKATEALKKQLERIHDALYDYYIMTGNGQYWYSSSDNKLCFKINGAYALFDSVRVDGKTLDRSCYTAASGSTIITFNDSFTKTLSDGEHRISIIYNDGAATGVFYVNPRGYVATGDGAEPALYLLVMALSTAGAALSSKGLKRSKE